jgi:hypothetical protein
MEEGGETIPHSSHIGKGLSSSYMDVGNTSPEDLSPTAEPEALPHVFEKDQWIGCGKTWSDDFPAFVKAARSSARLIPDWLRALCFPAPETPVPAIITTFLSEPDPSLRPTGLLAHFTSAQYVSDTPTITLEKQSDVGVNVVHHLRHHNLRLSETKRLRTSFNASWLTGMQSITLPHIPNIRFPLWAESFLSELATFRANCQIWIKAWTICS